MNTQILEALNEAVVITNADQASHYLVQYANAAFCRMTGYSQAELLGKSLKILQGPKTDMNVIADLRMSIQAGEYFEGETFNYTKAGRPYFVRWSVSPIFGKDGKIESYFSVQQDLTSKLRQEVRCNVIDATLAQLNQPVVVTTPDLQIEFMNPAAEAIFGALNGAPFLNTAGIDGHHLPNNFVTEQVSAFGQEKFKVRIPNENLDTPNRYFEFQSMMIKENRLKEQRVVFFGQDITREIYARARLEVSARFDRMTGAHSRNFGETFLSRLVEDETNHTPFALFLIDVDDFKAVNDTFGHAQGDVVLRRLSTILRATLDVNDALIRWGGDELLLVKFLPSELAPADYAEFLLSLIRGDAQLSSKGVSVSVSYGCPERGESLQDLLERLDKSLYTAKGAGKDRAFAA